MLNGQHGRPYQRRAKAGDSQHNFTGDEAATTETAASTHAATASETAMRDTAPDAAAVTR